MFTYISNSDHYKEVLSRVQSVKHTLWIGTADMKDLYVEVGKEKKPFLALIAQLIRRGGRCGLFMQRNQVPTSARTLTNTLYCMTAWSECFVLVSTLKYLSLTAKKSISAARI